MPCVGSHTVLLFLLYARIAVEPAVIEQLRVWVVELADEADTVERRAPRPRVARPVARQKWTAGESPPGDPLSSGRSGGIIATPLPARLGPAGSDHQARSDAMVPAVKQLSAADECARPLAVSPPPCLFCASCGNWGGFRRLAERPSPLRPVPGCTRLGTKAAGSRSSFRRCEGTLYGAPSRRLAALVSFGNLGMRDLRNA